MSVSLGFNSETIGLFKFEPFSFRWEYSEAISFRVTASPFVRPNVTTTSDSVFFSSTVGYGLTTAGETIVIEALNDDGDVLATSTNVVSVGNARFVTSDGTTLEGQRFVFHKGEPISNTTIVAAFGLVTAPTVTPTLPNGVVFGSSSPDGRSHVLTGTPTVQSPTTTFSIVGSNVGSTKLARSIVSIAVNAERVRLDLCGTGIASQMQVGTPIAEQVLTTRYPPYPWSGSNLRYTFTPLPGGLEFADIDGIARSSPFTPGDSQSTLVLRGTPTLDGARQFATLGLTSAEVLVTATRTIQPLISNSQSFTFSFAETVLFDDRTFDRLYSGVPLDPSRNFVRAQTFFGLGATSGIASIVSPDLRSDLSLNFVAAEGRAYLIGTPTAIGSNQFTLRATNSNATVGTAVVSVVVAEDVVTLTPPTDLCYNFVLSRPVSSALTGYYRAPLTWQATAESGRAVTFSAPALVGTGLTLDVSGGRATLAGIPDTVTSLQTLRVTASAVGSPATASRDASFAVVPDVFTFRDVPASSLTFLQNKSITPFQVVATTLSERLVTSYTSSTLPGGLSISTTGRVSGTPTTSASGSFSVLGSTGYASSSRSYSYSMTPDTIVFEITPTSYTYSPGDPVSIDVNAVSFSGASVGNYAFSNFTQSYGLSIGSQSGVISGTLVSGNPPGVLLPVSSNFQVRATAGAIDGSLSMVMTTTNSIVDRSFLLGHRSLQPQGAGEQITPGLYTSDNDPSYSSWTLRVPGEFPSLARKNDTIDSNTYIACDVSSGGIVRSTNGVDWQSYSLGGAGNRAYAAINQNNSSNWIIAGTGGQLEGVSLVFYFTSSTNGITWTKQDTGELLPTRESIGAGADYYSSNGVAVASNNGVLLLGGGRRTTNTFRDKSTVLRSPDGGATWSQVTEGEFGREVAMFNTSAPTWVMAGSDLYARGSNQIVTTSTTTLRWSDTSGSEWYDATGTTPNVGCYEVAYASNTWLASGLSLDSSGTTTTFVCSSNGKAWSGITLPETFRRSPGLVPPDVGPLWSDGTNWNAMIKVDSTLDSSLSPCKIYTHPLTGDLTTGWTVRSSAVAPFDGLPGVFSPSFQQQFVRLGTPTTVTIASVATASGPVLVSPADTSLLFYQYVTIAPIVFSATGTGPIFFLVETADLPPGLLFDPITATLSGKSVVLGTASFILFVKDDQGVTRVTISVTTILPAIVRPTTSAAAYTSLVRQYTEVNAARNAENNVVYPGESRGIGAFARPTPPNEITQTVDPTCFSTSNCR